MSPRTLLAAAAAAAVLISAGSASAATSCVYHPNASPKTIDVFMTGAGDVAELRVDPFDHEVLVGDEPCAAAAGNPVAHTGTVDLIRVSEATGGGTTVRIDDPAAFGPGETPEGPFSDDEIEIALDLGTGDDALLVTGTDGEDGYVLGAGGINASDQQVDFDPDITWEALERVTVFGVAGDDRISGLGGAGTGAAASVDLHLNGGGDDDALAGGAGDDDLSAARASTSSKAAPAQTTSTAVSASTSPATSTRRVACTSRSTRRCRASRPWRPASTISTSSSGSPARRSATTSERASPARPSSAVPATT